MKTIESLEEQSLERIGVNKACLGVLWRGGTWKDGLLVALFIGTLGLAQSLRAAEFTCASGDVACLITAINTANANGQANTITLKAGTYTTLTAARLPVVTSSLTITGREAETTIIDGAFGGGILNVAATGKLTLQRLTLRNGSSGQGGGIFNSGTLTLIDCILANNFAFLGAGGGLFNDNGTVIITRTTFDGNSAGFGAGGLQNGSGTGTLREGGTVTIANSTFVHNTSNDGVGGLGNSNMGIMTLTNTTVAQNMSLESGGGITNSNGILLLQSSTVADNRGGPGPFGLLAGGIANVGGIVLLQNTILARNDTAAFAPPPPVEPADCSGPITSLGNNLIGDPTAKGCIITLQPTDLTGDPGLGTFTDNGTPGNGHFPLLSSSQAIDAGNNAVCLRRDQLGRRRIGPCDIGAISFRGKDDHRHEEKDDHRHEENTAKAIR